MPPWDNKGRLPEIVAEDDSYPGAAQAEDRACPDTEPIEEQEENTEDAVEIGATSSPNLDEDVCDTFNEHSNEIMPGLDSLDGSEATVINQLDSSPEFATDSNSIPIRALEDPIESSIRENKSALPSISPSREAHRPEESDKWVSLAKRANTDAEQKTFNAELQQAAAINHHVELALSTESPTIHILGTGPTGKYIAHALASLPEAPAVTFLMHQPLAMQQWHDEGANIKLFKNGKIDTKSNFNVESSAHMWRKGPAQRFPGFGKPLQHTAEPPTTVIDCLIVTSNSHTLIAALSAIKHRLRRSSTICFLQDGLGVVDLVDASVFRNPETRPSYMLGSISHELISTQKNFTLLEKTPGSMMLTMIPRNLTAPKGRRISKRTSPLIRRIDHSWTPMSKYLMRALICAPELGAAGVTPPEFYEMQLQKLAVNSVIGPLSVVYDCYNDEILSNYSVRRSMRMLLNEISTILQSLPEVSQLAKLEKRFSAEKLEAIIVGVLGKTGKNLTSMLRAIRRGDKTDIDFHNGYLLDRAAELRINCPHLEMIVAMLKGKQAMKSREKNSFVPFKA